MIIDFALDTMQDMQKANEEALEKCYTDWDLSKNMPRKQKKAFRKDILLRHRIFSYYKEKFYMFE